MRPLLNDKSFNLFVKWLVAISKDLKYAQVVVGSSDGFTMDMLQSQLDPNYVKVIVLKDLTEKEQDIVIREHDGEHKKIPNEDLQAIGGHMGHLNDLLTHGPDYMGRLIVNEESRLSQVKYDASSACSWKDLSKGFWNISSGRILGQLSCECFTQNDFHEVMKVLAKSPEVKRQDLLDKGISDRALESMVHSNYLFYSPKSDTISARNPLFLQCWIQQNKKQTTEKS